MNIQTRRRPFCTPKLRCRRQVSKTADWLTNFYKDACAQRWPLTYCGDWKRSEKISENKKCEIERAIEWYFELLLIFAWPVRKNLCSFINGNVRRKIGLLKNSMKLMDCSCLPTTTTMFGFCFGLPGYTGRISGFVSFKIRKRSVNLEHQPFSGIWIRQTSRPLNFQIWVLLLVRVSACTKY